MVVITKNDQVYDKTNNGLELLNVSGIWSYHNGVLATLDKYKILIQFINCHNKAETIELRLNTNYDKRQIMSVWANEITTLVLDKTGTLFVYNNSNGVCCNAYQVIKNVELNMLNNLHIDVSEDYHVVFSYNNIAYKFTYYHETTMGHHHYYFDIITKTITCDDDYSDFTEKNGNVLEYNGSYMHGKKLDRMFSLKYGIIDSKRVMIEEDECIELEDDEHPYFENEEVIRKGRINRTKPARK